MKVDDLLEQCRALMLRGDDAACPDLADVVEGLLQRLEESSDLRHVAWWEAYLAVLPVLLAANPDGDPTRKAAHLADFSVGAFDRAQPSEQP